MRRLVLAACLATPVAAQQAPAPPAEPPAVAPGAVTPAPEDAGFADWLQARAPSEEGLRPGFVQGGRFEVLVLTPVARRAAHAAGAMRPVVDRCAAAVALGETTREEVVATDPWSSFESATAATPLVAISVVPSHGQATVCGAPDGERWASLARGVRFGRKPRYEGTNDARTALLLVDGQPVTPALSGRVPVTEVARGTLGRDGTMQVRLYVAPDAFAPGPRGAAPTVEVLVWSATESSPDRIRLDTLVVKRVWEDALRWRARRLRLADTERALDDLTATGIAPRERLVTRLRVARAFRQAGDTLAARGFAGSIVAQEPCMTLAADDDPWLRQTVDRLRPQARCTTIPLSRIALRSVLPGFGQATGGRRNLAGAVSFVAVAGAVLIGKSAHASARSKYEDYQTYDGFFGGSAKAASLYDAAESARALGNTMIVGAAALWVIVTAEGLLAEQRHAERVRDVQELDAPARRVGVAPMVGVRTVGLSLRFF